MKIEVSRNDLIDIIRSCQLYDTKNIQKYVNLHIGYFHVRAYTWIWLDESKGGWNDLSEQELMDIYKEIRESKMEYIKKIEENKSTIKSYKES